MNFSQVKAITIPEGAVKQITDGLGRVLWKAQDATPTLSVNLLQNVMYPVGWQAYADAPMETEFVNGGPTGKYWIGWGYYGTGALPTNTTFENRGCVLSSGQRSWACFTWSGNTSHKQLQIVVKTYTFRGYFAYYLGSGDFIGTLHNVTWFDNQGNGDATQILNVSTAETGTYTLELLGQLANSSAGGLRFYFQFV